MARLPRIRGTQVGLRNPAAVDAIKADMLAGDFRYLAPEGRVGGIVDPAGTYYVMEGHHRVVAALELFRETGDDRYVLELIRHGVWDLGPRPPSSRPMPARSLWGRLRNRIGF